MTIRGRPVLFHLLDRVCASSLVTKENVVVCTTKESLDDSLVRATESYGCSTFRGSTDDLIERLWGAVEAWSFDAVIQVDGDDPLADPEYMDLTMQALLNDPACGVVTCEGLPLGIASKSFTRAALQRVIDHYVPGTNDTGFSYYLTRSGLCQHRTLGPVRPQDVLDAARLTLDYPEDFEVIEAVFCALYQEGQVFSLRDVNEFLRSNPQVMRKNAALAETYRARTEALVHLPYFDGDGVRREIHE